MNNAADLCARARVHPDWQPLLEPALASLDAEYVAALIDDPHWLPGPERLLAAFRAAPDNLRYLLIGESPYPRANSANGIAFYDAAVSELWSDTGLSKAVNRATSLRNIIKTALLAEGRVQADADGGLGQAAIARLDKDDLVQTLPELFANLQRDGFLMINATPVLHPGRKPAAEARYWQGFLEDLLDAIAAATTGRRIRLLLWGRIAHRVAAMPASQAYEKLVCEHPYNLSFIDNPDMRALFAELKILRRRDADAD